MAKFSEDMCKSAPTLEVMREFRRTCAVILEVRVILLEDMSWDSEGHVGEYGGY